MKALWLCCLLIPGVALADIVGATSRNMNFEFKLGPFKPLIDRESTLTGTPYETTFGGGPLLLGEFELERQFFQKVGTLGAGLSIGYGEKFGHAVNAVTGEITEESTGLHLIPMKALLVYRFDYLAQTYSVPLVPYVKGAFIVCPWWITKGADIEVVDGVRGQSVNYGVAFTGGLALQLDFLDPRLARDFDTSAGVNHTYLFAEWSLQELNLGGGKIDLSSRHWMFGLSFEF
ncbi:MAG: hypothetical protein K1X89_31670 [Myxococcaceae bacterium]|nr:hypothetical protein [Myxococcaceae bacterium]